MSVHFEHASVIFNVEDQTLEYYPPTHEVLVEGAPTSAAGYSCYGGTESNDSDVKFSGTATLDATSTTVASASGQSQTVRNRVTLVSVSNIVVGQRYLLKNASSQGEVVVAAAISGSNVTLTSDLSFDYTASVSSTFKGLRHSLTVPSAFVTDEANLNYYGGTEGVMSPPYRLRWAYTTGTTPRQSWTTFDLSRQQAKSGLTAEDLKQVLPDSLVSEWLTQNGQHFEPQIAASWERVLFDIKNSGYQPDAVRDARILRQLHLRALVLTIAEAGYMIPTYSSLESFIEHSAKNYESAYTKTINGSLRAWIDTSGTGAIDPSPAQQLWLKR